MLWLCILLPQLPLEALHAEEAEQALVVTACEGNTRWVLSCNDAARRAGLKPALNYTVALAIHPQLLAYERKLQAEHAALQRLAAWAYQFSSTVITAEIPLEFRLAHTSAVWLEIGASLKLFGGFRSFIEHLEHELQSLHYTYRLGIGPTLEGAALLARAGIRLAITTPHALFTRVRNLPASLLTLTPEASKQLYTMGVRTIGLMLELPRPELTKRFGAELMNYLDRLTGAAPDPRPVFQLPAKYDARFEFGFEVAGTEALLFPLQRMLRELSGYLRAHDTAVQHFSMTLKHRDHPATQLHIGLSMPDRDATRFLALVREQLDRLVLPAATLQLALSAEQFAAPTALQSDLLNGAPEQHEELAHTIDRIAARLGDEHIHGVEQRADHRPEAGWRAVALEAKRSSCNFPQRPLWLLPEPKPLPLNAIAEVLSGPERVESGWWDGHDVEREYFVARTRSGARLWVFQDLHDGSWHLHGFWS